MHFPSDITNILNRLNKEFGNCKKGDAFYDVSRRFREFVEEKMGVKEEFSSVPKHEKPREKSLLEWLIDVILKIAAKWFGKRTTEKPADNRMAFIKNYSKAVHLYDKNSISSFANPKAFSPFSKDPKIRVTPENADSAEKVGRFWKFLDIFSPMLTAACDNLVEFSKEFIEDIKDESYRETVVMVLLLIIKCLMSANRSGLGTFVRQRAIAIGATVGTIVTPGYGTMIGGAVGLVAVGFAIGLASKPAVTALKEYLLNILQRDIVPVNCEKCGQKFECRRYEEGNQKKCENCRNEETD